MKDTAVTVEKIKWHRLKDGCGEELMTEMRYWLSDILHSEHELTMDELWNNCEEVCVIKAKQHLGVSKGRLKNKREFWW